MYLINTLKIYFILVPLDLHTNNYMNCLIFFIHKINFIRLYNDTITIKKQFKKKMLTPEKYIYIFIS